MEETKTGNAQSLKDAELEQVIGGYKRGDRLTDALGNFFHSQVCYKQSCPKEAAFSKSQRICHDCPYVD